jgi:hypothetical protein
MLEARTREIDGLEFTVSMLPPKKARATLLRLSRLVGPALAELAQGKAESILDLDTSHVLAAVSRFFAGMAEEDLEHFVSTFQSVTLVPIPDMPEAKPIPPGDALFAGRGTLIVFKWLIFCLEVNYSDFLDELKGQLTRLPTRKASLSQFPKGIDWDVWRIVTSGKVQATLHEIETHWSIVDIFDANQVLNAFAIAEEEQRERSKR